MKISLRAGERIYGNGAVLCVDRKGCLELVNDVMFLLEGQGMQAGDATTGTVSSATSSTKNTSTNTVDYNTFLQLLIAQMKNQDPTNPTDASQYMSQFAQLSTVEQAMQTNSKLDALLSSSALSQADGL